MGHKAQYEWDVFHGGSPGFLKFISPRLTFGTYSRARNRDIIFMLSPCAWRTMPMRPNIWPPGPHKQKGAKAWYTCVLDTYARKTHSGGVPEVTDRNKKKKRALLRTHCRGSVPPFLSANIAHRWVSTRCTDLY